MSDLEGTVVVGKCDICQCTGLVRTYPVFGHTTIKVSFCPSCLTRAETHEAICDHEGGECQDGTDPAFRMGIV